MSNVFIMTQKHLPRSVSAKIVPSAILYNFLWIGGNSIGKYHINQYRGPTNNLKLFKKDLTKILKNKKYSIITGNTSFLQKPSEREFQINYSKDTSKLKKPIYSHKLKLFSKKKDFLKILSGLKKTKYGYHLPILLLTYHNSHPVNIKHDIFFKIENGNIFIQGYKHPVSITEAWLKRLEMLL